MQADQPLAEWAQYPLYCPITGLRLIHSPNSLRLFEANPAAWYYRYQCGLQPRGFAQEDSEDDSPRSKGGKFAQAMKVGLECYQVGGSWVEGQNEAYGMADELGMTPAEMETIQDWWDTYPPFKNLRWVERPFFLPTGLAPRGSLHQHVIFGICDVVADGLILDHKTSARTFHAPHYPDDPYPSRIMEYLRSWQMVIYGSVSQMEWGPLGKVCLDTVRWPGKTVDAQFTRYTHHYPLSAFEDLHKSLDITFRTMQLYADQAYVPRRRPVWPLGPDWETALDHPKPEAMMSPVPMEHPVQRYMEQMV